MPGRLQHRSALITGAASGIGLESSILFALEGANVLLVDINERAVREAATNLAKKTPNVKIVSTRADVGREEDIKAAVDKAVAEFGRLDIMFNNAGIMHPADDNALNTEEKIWDMTMQINLKGVWWGCKYAILAMRDNSVDEGKGLRKGGSIINTASFVALMGAATPQLAYTASKGAVLAMTRELAMVHAREGIRLNSICPGPLKTPLLMDFLNAPEKKERRLVHLPLGRFGEAVEVAKGALFLLYSPLDPPRPPGSLSLYHLTPNPNLTLNFPIHSTLSIYTVYPVASDDSSYVTGTDFKVEGGLTSCYVTPLGEPGIPPPESLTKLIG